MPIARTFIIPRRIRLVVFDLDGTLITHGYSHWCREAVRIYPRLGARSVTLARVRRDFGMGDMFASLPLRGRDDLIERFWEMYDHRTAPLPRCLPGVRGALQHMKASDLTIAVATARLVHATTVEAMLKRSRLDALVDFVLTCLNPNDQVHSSKVPLLLQLLGMANVSGSQALMVGDTPTDIECARLAGYALQIAVCSGGLTETALAASKPSSMVRQVSSLRCLARTARRIG